MDAAGEKFVVRGRKYGKNESPWVSVFNICNAAIGAGVLSFPFGFRQTGVLGGFLFTAIVWVIEVFALCLLIRVAEKYNSQSYQQLVHSLLGYKTAVITSVTMLTFLIGSMLSYLIISGDVFAPVFADFGISFLADRRVVITILAVLVILPLALKTTLESLKFTSVISVAMLAYLTVALITIGVMKLVTSGLPSDILIFRTGKHVFVLMDIVVFAFQCHIQVVIIFAELAENPNPFLGRAKGPLEERLLEEEVISELSSRRFRSEKVKRMDGIIFIAMSICFIGYCLVGEFGYLIFPDVESDVLKSFGDSNVFMNVARFGMALVAMVCYPLQSHAARLIVDDAVKAMLKIPANSFSWTRHITITMVFFLSTLLVALLITDLGTVFSIVGSTGGVMVVFIVPGILLIKGSHNVSIEAVDAAVLANQDVRLNSRSSVEKWMQIMGGIFIILFGVLIFAATTYVTAAGMFNGPDEA